LEAAGCLQLCAGQQSRCEAAIHAMQDIFLDSHNEGVLLVDAFNRNAALLNMFHLCPPLAITLTNMYNSAAALFIDGI